MLVRIRRGVRAAFLRRFLNRFEIADNRVDLRRLQPVLETRHPIGALHDLLPDFVFSARAGTGIVIAKLDDRLFLMSVGASYQI